MRYVHIESIIEDGRHKGYLLDPEPYIEALPQLQAALPPGAKVFALDQEHYNFFGTRSVKDLAFTRMAITSGANGLSSDIWFAANPVKHDRMLVLRYTGVTEFISKLNDPRSSTAEQPEPMGLGDFQLDEILPHPMGCSHEIQMTRGNLRIVAVDLTAEWRNPEEVVEHEDG